MLELALGSQGTGPLFLEKAAHLLLFALGVHGIGFARRGQGRVHGGCTNRRFQHGGCHFAGVCEGFRQFALQGGKVQPRHLGAHSAHRYKLHYILTQ